MIYSIKLLCKYNKYILIIKIIFILYINFQKYFRNYILFLFWNWRCVRFHFSTTNSTTKSFRLITFTYRIPYTHTFTIQFILLFRNAFTLSYFTFCHNYLLILSTRSVICLRAITSIAVFCPELPLITTVGHLVLERASATPTFVL